MLTAARDGEEWAWSRLYEDLSAPVLGYVRARGAAEPEDVLAEVFLQVVRNLESFSGDWSGFRSWVFTIAHRRVIDELRYRARHPVDPVADPELSEFENDPSSEVMDRMTAEETIRMLSRLTSAQRDVLLLRVIGGFTAEEAARIVGKSPGAVKALQRRGLREVEENLTNRVTL